MTHNTPAVVAFGEPAWARHSKRILFLCTHLNAALSRRGRQQIQETPTTQVAGVCNGDMCGGYLACRAWMNSLTVCIWLTTKKQVRCRFIGHPIRALPIKPHVSSSRKVRTNYML